MVDSEKKFYDCGKFGLFGANYRKVGNQVLNKFDEMTPKIFGKIDIVIFVDDLNPEFFGKKGGLELYLETYRLDKINLKVFARKDTANISSEMNKRMNVKVDENIEDALKRNEMSLERTELILAHGKGKNFVVLYDRNRDECTYYSNLASIYWPIKDKTEKILKTLE